MNWGSSVIGFLSVNNDSYSALDQFLGLNFQVVSRRSGASIDEQMYQPDLACLQSEDTLSPKASY